MYPHDTHLMELVLLFIHTSHLTPIITCFGFFSIIRLFFASCFSEFSLAFTQFLKLILEIKLFIVITGPGEIASVELEVHQPPSFKYKLKPLETKRVGEPNFSVACSAKGKPRPIVKWLKDDEELTADTNMYEVKTEYSETSNGAINVQSVLKFSGKARPNSNELLPSDRGVYTCSFENEVKRSESTMHLKIERK